MSLTAAVALSNELDALPPRRPGESIRMSCESEKLKFRECFNLQGAFNSLNDKSSDYLLWERFTTVPYTTSNNLRHIGDCPTPWPCFVIVSRSNFVEKQKNAIDSILSILNNFTIDIKNISNLKNELATNYNMNQNEVEAWLSITEWSQKPLNQRVYDSILSKIKSYGIIS